jgi:predicted DNA-binding transcriptional regulator AlpA
MTGLTVADLDSLPPAIDLVTAARVLGIGRTTAYQLARRGQFPCRVIRVGGLYRVATPDLIRLLTDAGRDTPEAAGQ